MESVMRIEDFDGEIQFCEVNGEYCLTTEQIAKGLGYSDPECVRTLIQRNLEEIEPFRISHHGDGKIGRGRPGYLYTEEGVYLISMMAQTPKAREFRAKIAKLLRMLRQRQMDNLKHELLARNPFWRNIMRYKGLGLNHKEIGLLLCFDTTTIRKQVRKMESCGLLMPPKDLPKLQKCVEHFKNRLN